MALQVVTSTAVPTRFVLACDDAVREANTAEALDAYARTRDASALVIPQDATWVSARALDRRALVLHDMRTSAAPGDDVARGLARLEAICADVVESINDFPDLQRNADGYPVRALYDRMRGGVVLALLAEIVEHVVAVSTLGKAQPSPSAPLHGEASQSVTATAATSTAAQPARSARGSRPPILL